MDLDPSRIRKVIDLLEESRLIIEKCKAISTEAEKEIRACVTDGRLETTARPYPAIE